MAALAYQHVIIVTLPAGQCLVSVMAVMILIITRMVTKATFRLLINTQ